MEDVLVNQRGDLIQLRLHKVDNDAQDNILQPEVTKNADCLTLVTFDVVNEKTGFVLLGDYLCWSSCKSVFYRHLQSDATGEINVIEDLYFSESSEDRDTLTN